MKKIFTTLAAVAMVAMSADAAVTVTYEGKNIENGGEIVLTNEDFKDISMPEYEYYQWQAEAEPVISGNNPIHLRVETESKPSQCCPNGNCIPWKTEGSLCYIDQDIKSASFNCAIHMIINEKTLPDGEFDMKITATDDESSLTFTVVARTTGDSGVEEIMAGDATVAAIYDMQGRPVSEDFRGAAIVVYDNGKAVKQIIK